MGENLLEASSLLIIGMGSAFFVLFLIGVLGRLLIRYTNRFAEISSPAVKQYKHNMGHIVAITAAVEQITQGEGRVSDIQKIEH